MSFCNWLALSLPFATWMVYGDFNMVEKPTDKKSLNPIRWYLGERESWFFFKNKLILYDPNSCFACNDFPYAQCFTWSNFQSGDSRVIKRLDRAMISKIDYFHFDHHNPTRPFVSMVSSTTMSNHAPIFFSIYHYQLPTHIFKS